MPTAHHEKSTDQQAKYWTLWSDVEALISRL